MRISLLPFAIFAFLATSVSQGQEKDENPFKKAKVGDFVAYKMTTSVAGKDIEITMKQTVTAKDEKEVTLTTTTMFMGKSFPGQESKVDLSKPYDPTAAATANKKGKFDKTGEGREKIKVGNKEYECTWLTGKVTADANGKKLETDMKAWFSKTVPLTGMIKMEMKSNFANITMELADSGSAK